MERSLKEFKYTLENHIKSADRIFVTPHINVDFDAIGAAIGMIEICRHFGKKAIMIMDDSQLDMNIGVRSIFDPIKDKYTVITSSALPENRTNNDLLILVDVNKTNLISTTLRDQLETFSEKVILDHHKEDEYTIPTEYKHIDITTSSTCEMITRLFRFYSIHLDATLAKCFLAGIFLDTNKLRKNTDQRTLEIAAKLISVGVSIQDVNDLFLEDFENDRKVQHLIDGTTFVAYRIHNVAVISDKNDPQKRYTRVELAQAADYLLQYKVDAAYAIGVIGDSEVGISARSLGGMDIAGIMHVFGGGGNDHSAAARILDTNDIELIKQELFKLLCREDFYTVKSSVLSDKLENRLSEKVEENSSEKQKAYS